MEMSPKAIAAVTFPVVRKGYDPEQVRSFLSQLSRGVEELQNRALQAEAKTRLTTATPEAASTRPMGPTWSRSPRRWCWRSGPRTRRWPRLARRPTASAGRRRNGPKASSPRRTPRRPRSPPPPRRRRPDRARRRSVRVQTEVEALEARRQALLAHSDALQQHVTSQRERLASTVQVLQRTLDDPDGLHDVARPEAPDQAAASFAGGTRPSPPRPVARRAAWSHPSRGRARRLGRAFPAHPATRRRSRRRAVRPAVLTRSRRRYPRQRGRPRTPGRPSSTAARPATTAGSDGPERHGVARGERPGTIAREAVA